MYFTLPYKPTRLSLIACLIVSFYCLSPITVNTALKGSYSIDAKSSAYATSYVSLSTLISDLVSGSRFDGGTPNDPGVSVMVTITVALQRVLKSEIL